MPPAVHIVRGYALTDEWVLETFAQRIHTRLPRSKVFPLVIMRTGPGGRRTVPQRVQRTPIDVHVYADPTSPNADKAAELAAGRLHALLLDASGHVDTERGAVILDIEEISAPYPAPDDTDNRDEPLARWMSTVAAHIRPNP